MSAYKRNMIVGVTVLGALVGLVAMLLRFGGTTIKAMQPGHQIEVHFVFPQADGVNDGSSIQYHGVNIGKVLLIKRDANGEDVDIDAQLDNTPPLPGNTEGVIRNPSLIGGGAIISIELADGQTVRQGQLVDGQKMVGRFVGSELIPPKFAELAAALEKTTKEIQDAKLVDHVDETIRGARDYLNDPKLRNDIQTALDNFRQSSESIAKSSANVERFSTRLDTVAQQAQTTLADAHDTITDAKTDLEKLSHQIDERMLTVGKSLDAISAITDKVNSGEGTAGLLVNDPKLYQSLVDNSKQLSTTINDLHRLIDQWEQEGVSLKLK